MFCMKILALALVSNVSSMLETSHSFKAHLSTTPHNGIINKLVRLTQLSLSAHPYAF